MQDEGKNIIDSLELFDEFQFDVKYELDSAYSTRHYVELIHKGLNKKRTFKSTDSDFLMQSLIMQMRTWDEQWQRITEKENNKRKIEEKKESADRRTQEAEQIFETLRNLLNQTLKINDAVDWESLKDKSKFLEPRPKKVNVEAPSYLAIPKEPQESDLKYTPAIYLVDKLLRFRMNTKMRESKDKFNQDYSEWQTEKQRIENEKDNLKKQYNRDLLQAEKDYKDKLSSWENKHSKFIQDQENMNRAVDARKDEYYKGLPDAIVDYCDMVLANSIYPDFFPDEFDIEYLAETKTLVLDYQLLAPEDIPRTKSVKYIKASDKYVVSEISASELNKIYDDIIYQVTLRTIHELYEADVISALDAVAFNGWVQTIDKSTGTEISPCILSIHVQREAFLSINLTNVDPKACFKNLKGIAATKLNSLTPIAPIIQMTREDRRFIESYAVAQDIEGSNLATMDWADFEHLIRELFEQEFSQDGAEVKVTQASKDGGVDAVMFNPDPLRGGKIIIQAKRYTNTVGVSAVRDLYGTVVNEGATKGILVTTADFGPDAYNFAKDKPITLINGSNLLYLLEKNGHKARINIKEAKDYFKENK
jgi:restriction system protein